MSVTYTEEQARAIAARGKVIVSASAGSGKTFVMIERLVSLILGGADVREVLAVTFTNKAAAQMREKLRSALLKKIGETDGEERARLKDQLNALPMAEISTIHAFCGRLVRANFYLAGVDAAFRIVSPDDSDGQELSARAMEETFENAYAEGGEAFRRLLSVYFRKKKDARLRSAVASLHRKFRGLSEYREKLAAVGKESLFEEACAYLAEDYRTRAREIAESAEELAPCFDGRSAKAGAVCADVLGAARELLERDDLFALCALPAPNISRMPPTTRAVGEEAVRLKRLSALSKRIKALYSELRVYGSREEEEARCRDAEELAAALAELTLRYDGIYERLKAERGVLDYDDLEHFALKVLSDGDALAAVRERYKYLFVDEYQDVNPAQEKLLSLVGGEEIFLVGDRKQSIYGFRGSKSEYFTQKTEAFGQTLCLTENFRSAAAVLDAVNRVFTRAMTPSVCGFAYAENLLRGGRRYGTHEGSVCFHRIPTEKREKQPPAEVYSVCADQTAKKRDAQAEEIVRIVRDELGSAIFDADLGEERRVRLGDVAVLVRKTTGDAERVVAALSDCGIPVTATAKVNLCEFREIRLLLDWLSYLDNAEQDVPFAA
ncbi:MAG: UvrD-helicase domain-containing protein, partial [Candidatus Gallimonas sp.]